MCAVCPSVRLSVCTLYALKGGQVSPLGVATPELRFPLFPASELLGLNPAGGARCGKLN